MATRMQQRRGTAAQWISTNSGNGPILNAGEIGFESDTNKFKIGDGINHWIALDYFLDANSTANPSFGSSITFEGATDNTFETTVSVTDPTADRTITLPDATGTVALTSDVTTHADLTVAHGATGAVVGTTNTQTLTNKTLTSPVINTPTGITKTDVGLSSVDNTTDANKPVSTATQTALDLKAPLASPTFTGTVSLDTGVNLVFEGATADAHETTLTVTDPTADRTITFPNATGTVVLADGGGNVTVSGDLTVSGATTIINSTVLEVQNEVKFEGSTANDFETSLKVVDPTADRVITFPDATGTVAILDTTQTLTNKTINLTSNTLATTLAQLNTAVSDADVASLAGTETLTNKTLTSPNINEAVALTATATELNVLDGITSSTAELNILDGVTSTAAELNILDGVTASAAQINVLASLTSSATELNILDGVVATTAELNYVNGVTSAIQTQLNNKQAVVANVSDTEIGYLDGVTSAIQTQLNGKQATVANVSDVEIGYLDGVTSAIQTQMDAKAPLASPTFTGTVTLPSGTVTSTMILDGTIANADINAAAAIDWTKLGISSTVSSTEIGYVDGVTSAIQTQLDAKAPLASPTFTGTVNAAALTLSGDLTVNGTTTTINSTTLAVDDKNIVIGDVTTPSDVTADGGGITLKGATDKTFNWVDATDSWTSSEHINLASGKDLKVNGTAVISSTAGGFIFTDGTQTLEGVPSRTPIIQKTASYTLSALTERDDLIEMGSASAMTLTIPLNSAVAFPVGTSIDILQTSTGQVTIAGDAGVTVNSTPGLKLRTQWSTATLFKRATNTWVVYGDLTA